MYIPGGGGRQQVRFGGPITPAVKVLLIANAVIYVFTVLPLMIQSSGGIEVVSHIIYYLGMTPSLFWGGLTLWMPLTYMFIHSVASPMHLLFNMLALWMFGGDVENVFGTRQFIAYYLVCGAGAGLIVAILQPGLAIPTVGASGAIYGLLVAFGLFFPDRVILFSFIFPMKAKHFVLVITALVFLTSMTSSGDMISHTAHLGGLIVGFIFIRRRRIWATFKAAFGTRRRRTNLRVVDKDELRRILEDDNDNDHVVH